MKTSDLLKGVVTLDEYLAERLSEEKPKTNADRIRAMTDEELAEFLDRWELGDIDYAKTFCDLCNGQYDCHNDCLMDWLKQEATE